MKVVRCGAPGPLPDLFGLTRDDFIGQVKDIITVGEFYDLAAGGQIIFT
jgi:peroxiredoxin family protein